MAKCSKCSLVWTSLAECHCGKCCRHFAAVTGFDMHRKGGECVDPASLFDQHGNPKLVLRTSGRTLVGLDGKVRSGDVLAWRTPLSVRNADERTGAPVCLGMGVA